MSRPRTSLMVLAMLGVLKMRQKLNPGNQNTYEQGFYDACVWLRGEIEKHYAERHAIPAKRPKKARKK